MTFGPLRRSSIRWPRKQINSSRDFRATPIATSPNFNPNLTARQSVAAVDEIERPARLRACDKPPRKRKILDMEKVQALTENLSFMVSFDAEWLTRMQVAQPLNQVSR